MTSENKYKISIDIVNTLGLCYHYVVNTTTTNFESEDNQMLTISNQQLFDNVVERAISSVYAQEPSVSQAVRRDAWIHAIVKGGAFLRSNALDNLSFDKATNTLEFTAPAGNIYTTNATCQCEAYLHGKRPCYHRAMARLLTRYYEREAANAIGSEVRLELITPHTIECGSLDCGWRGTERDLLYSTSEHPFTPVCPKCDSDYIVELIVPATTTVRRPAFAAMEVL